MRSAAIGDGVGVSFTESAHMHGRRPALGAPPPMLG